MTFVIALVFALSVVPYFGETVLSAPYFGGGMYEFTLRSALWIACLLLGWSRRLLRWSGVM